MSQSAKFSETEPLCLPGFGKPVNDDFYPTFPSALFGGGLSLGITVREQRMMAFVSDVTDKPEWERKVFDEEIVSKWREEASARPEGLGGDVVLSEEMFDFVGFSLILVPIALAAGR